MSQLVPPHGSKKLKPLLIPKGDRAAELLRANTLPKINMTSREMSDLLLLSMGAYTPLDGFMGEADWRAVCTDMKLADGLFWPIPITLSISVELANKIKSGEEVALIDGETQTVMAILSVSEIYQPDKMLECEQVFGTNEKTHPGVAKVNAQAKFNLAGSVRVINEGWFPEKFVDIYYRPEESRKLFADLGWSKVAAFQTRNPMHRIHLNFAAKLSNNMGPPQYPLHHSLGNFHDLIYEQCPQCEWVLTSSFIEVGPRVTNRSLVKYISYHKFLRPYFKIGQNERRSSATF